MRSHWFLIFLLRPVNALDIDLNGYLFFCPCMGAFGNQAEHLIGGISFAIRLNRTLIVPPFRLSWRLAPFDEWFDLEALAEIHRVVRAEDFMDYLAPIVWPPEQRTGLCFQYNSRKPCSMKDDVHLGHAAKAFWNGLGVEFTKTESFNLKEFRSYWSANNWTAVYPPDKYPVMAMDGAPAKYPLRKADLYLQEYLVFNTFVRDTVEQLVGEQFDGQEYVGIHLRNGREWENVCSQRKKAPFQHNFMASYQCLGFDGRRRVTDEMCLPSTDTVIKTTMRAVEVAEVAYVLVATDKNAMLPELRAALPGVKDRQKFQLDTAPSAHAVISCQLLPHRVLNRRNLDKYSMIMITGKIK